MESIGRTWWHGFGWRLAEVPLAGSLKLCSGDEGGHGSQRSPCHLPFHGFRGTNTYQCTKTLLVCFVIYIFPYSFPFVNFEK